MRSVVLASAVADIGIADAPDYAALDRHSAAPNAGVDLAKCPVLSRLKPVARSRNVLSLNVSDSPRMVTDMGSSLGHVGSEPL